MDIKRLDFLLEKKASGTLTIPESDELDNWYKAFDEQTVRDYLDTHPSENEDIQVEMLSMLHQSLKMNEEGAVVKMQKPKKTAFFTFGRVAAACIILIAAACIWIFYPHPVQYVVAETGPGQVLQVMLPDSSMVWLNAESSLKYPKHFKGSSRKVLLAEGEAYFDVKHDAAHPFEVKCSKLNIKVLGTAFNIKAYHKLSQIKVVVQSGKIEVSDSVHALSQLTANQELSYQKNNGIYTESIVDADNLSDWKNGYVVLNAASFNEVALMLENEYGVRIDHHAFASDDFRYTIRFSRQLNIEEALEIIKAIHPMQYDIKGKNITISSK